MRITEAEAQAAVSVVRKHLGASAAVWLFGSRVDDAQKGGDVDIYAETDAASIALPAARARGELADVLGRHVDLIVDNHTRSPDFRHRKKTGREAGMKAFEPLMRIHDNAVIYCRNSLGIGAPR